MSENGLGELRKKLDEHEGRISALEEIVKTKPLKRHVEEKGTEALLLALKDEEFFKEKRTISQIRDALHAKGKIVKLTDLPKYLLKLVRTNVLKREKKEIDKKKVWVYFA
jgi:hypothetical protein